jgi:hypothetical protein
MSQCKIKNHEIEDFLCPTCKTLQLDGTPKKKKKILCDMAWPKGFPILVLVQAQEQGFPF